MKAIKFERSMARYAAAKVAGSLNPGLGARVGPLSLVEDDEPDLPAAGWKRVKPRLAGICGSDLATIDGKSTRYFEPLVSFPFVAGHEIVGDLEGGGRVVIEPVLACKVRGVARPAERAPRATASAASGWSSATSVPGFRPATAPTPAAAGRRRWSPTTARSTPCQTTSTTTPR